MDPVVLENSLEGLPIGPIRYFHKIDSTNDEALRWVEDGAPDLSLVVADEQTAGRGRHDRKWFTPPNSSLAFSLILRPPLNKPNTIVLSDQNDLIFTRLTALGALAVSGALGADFDLPVQIKWPNDLLVRGNKIAGVLVESTWSGEHLTAAVIGIGINVAPSSINNHQKFDTPATCVERELNHLVSRVELLRQVLINLVIWRERIHTDGFIDAWNERLVYRDEWVYLVPELDDPVQSPLQALILGLEQDGALRIQLKDGSIKTVYSGEFRIAANL